MFQQVRTLIVGGGQAGLSTSHYLAQQGHEHQVLEQAARAGNAWRNDRWDSFTLVTPNWAWRIPGAEYNGEDPHGFMPRDEVVARFERYVEQYHLPVRYDTRVAAIEQKPDGSGFTVTTNGPTFEAANVAVATGLFQQPKVPSFSTALAAEVAQLHSSQYRNPSALPPGAVLVVGSAQSGCQIAEELYLSGRTVYLSAGSAGRVPRRYRGKDIVEWLDLIGFFNRTPDMLPSPKARFAGNPALSGTRGGHAVNVHQFARDGVVLLGRLQGVRDGKIRLAPDLKENLARIDQFEAEVLKRVDGYIERAGLDAPQERVPELRDGYDAKVIEELDLLAVGISSVIWAMGYRFDFSLIKLPVVDEDGYPLQQRGVTRYPGLYFVGMPWLAGQRSGQLIGVGEHAAFIASEIAARR